MPGSRRHQKSSTAAQFNIHCKACQETFTRQDAQTGKVIRIQDEMYHFACFKCVNCQRPLGVSPCFTTSSAGPFKCKDCHRESTSPSCHACHKPTFEKCILAFDVYWHEVCFKCKGCNRQFRHQEYVVHEGCAYDEDCYYRLIKEIETPKRGAIRE